MKPTLVMMIITSVTEIKKINVIAHEFESNMRRILEIGGRERGGLVTQIIPSKPFISG